MVNEKITAEEFYRATYREEFKQDFQIKVFIDKNKEKFFINFSNLSEQEYYEIVEHIGFLLCTESNRSSIEYDLFSYNTFISRFQKYKSDVANGYYE